MQPTQEKLRFAFEVWTVEIFELTLKSPEAMSEVTMAAAVTEAQTQYSAMVLGKWVDASRSF